MATFKLKIISIIIAIISLFTIVSLLVFVKFDIKGHFDGIFILKDKDGKYSVKDDLYVGDAEQIVYSKDFDDPKFRIYNMMHPSKPGVPHIATLPKSLEGSTHDQKDRIQIEKRTVVSKNIKNQLVTAVRPNFTGQ